MFEGQKAANAYGNYPSQTPAGLWKVHVASGQYRAWKLWLHNEIGKNFFPEPVMVVWSEWPPTTHEAARMVAQSISDIRDSHYRNEREPIGGKPVPPDPAPWDGYVPLLPLPEPIVEDLAERRRDIVRRYLAERAGARRQDLLASAMEAEDIAALAES